MKSKLNTANWHPANRSRLFFVLLAAVLAVLTQPLLADVSKVENFDFELRDGGTLSIENINGDITITGGPGNEVQIIATKKAGSQEYLDGIEIHVSADNNRINIRTQHPKSSNRWFGHGDGSGSVTYEVIAPASTNLDSIDTVNGEIEVAGISGDVSADTTNGDIHLTGLSGSLEADTVNGSIDASFDRLGGNQRVVAETVNGRVQLRLPADASARIDCGTVNGGIDAGDFGLRVDKGFLGRDLDGEIGSGDARVKVSTVNGSVKIRKA